MDKQPRDPPIGTNEIDFRSPLPLYHQLQEIIRNEAMQGTIGDESGKMPTEQELMERFKVSRITIRHALKILEDEGIVRRERGRGTFLQTNQAEHWSGQLLGFAETISAAGMEPGAKMLAYGLRQNVSLDVRTHLKGTSAWELKRLRYANQVPIALEQSFFPPEIGKRMEERDLQSMIVYKFIESNIGISLRNGKQWISAINAGKEEAELLEVEEGSALLHLERVIFDSTQTPVEYLKAVYRPDQFHYTIHLHR
ncbi:HTH-type transcriptional repressor NagR [Paenibacillus solanacearum]|uniref:HTH-type transcriptional repressor NagR n=1 Tax=Paenibacillus solanacearum TaxID=2048548 RepID=A0A916K3S0_9BACL|nr:GntR family transcriptional regulator [Paenibacillus solanacearum]CAG7621274.1 HTH-type transcriptional repressor NagR [Paenibacillus solanacearum]